MMRLLLRAERLRGNCIICELITTIREKPNEGIGDKRKPQEGRQHGVDAQEGPRALEAQGWEAECLRIGGTAVRGCMACMKCVERQGRRRVIDGVVNECLEKMFEADAILLGSPTCFADVSAGMKAFIDRSGFVALANGSLLSGKTGAGVVAARRGGSIHVFGTSTICP